MNAREPCGLCRELPATQVIGGIPLCDLCAGALAGEEAEA